MCKVRTIRVIAEVETEKGMIKKRYWIHVDDWEIHRFGLNTMVNAELYRILYPDQFKVVDYCNWL